MAANRAPKFAPTELLSLSKATLADLVWEFAAHASESVDDMASRRAVILERAKGLEVPRSDLRIAEHLAGKAVPAS